MFIFRIYKSFQETRKISEAEMTSLKSQLRDLREEADELNITITEKNEQLQKYRNKVLLCLFLKLQ